MSIRKREKFKSIMLLLVCLFLFVFLKDNIIFADTYNCLAGTYCHDTGPGNLEISIPYYSCSNGTCVNSSNNWMTGCTWNGGSSCTQSAAPVSGYYSYSACVNDLQDVCVSWNTICKQSASCNPRTGFCGSPVQNRECSTSADCCYSWGQGSCRSYDTECGRGSSTIEAGTCCRPGEPPSPPCTPNTSCPDSICTDLGYSASPTSFGSITKTCPNGCGGELNKACYCSDCLKNCPLPLQNQNPTYPNLKLEDFRKCTNDCNVGPDESNDDCYEVESPQPTETLTIDSTLVVKNDFGFSSDSQTGDYDGFGDPDTTIRKQGRLNDPLSPIKMIAKYTDTNGASDIEGLFVWFRDESKYIGLPQTPILHSDSATPKTSKTDSWGFMLRRIGTDWIPYVPSYGTSEYWTKLPTTPPFVYPFTFFIYGPSGVEMVQVTILERPLESGNDVTMKYSLKFSDENGTLFGGANTVSSANYKIWLMGLDKFSFTPYDNYPINYGTYWTSNYTRYPDTTLNYYWKPEELRYKAGQDYARAWTDSGKTWTLDFTDPMVTFSKTINLNTINISWTANDDRNLYAIVGNIYTNAGSDARQIDLDVEGTPSPMISLNPSNGVFIPIAVGSNIVGNLDNGWSFKVGPDLNSSTNSGSINIKVQNNTSGILTIYLHVFDDAGNVTVMTLTENLADRLLTSGGLAYSYGGINFAQLTPKEDSAWSGKLPPYANPSEGLLRKNAGNTSEMLSRYSSTVDVLVNSSVGSYAIGNYRNSSISNSTSFYDSLRKAYLLHKKYLEPSLQEITLPSTLSGNLSLQCSNSYCVFSRDGNLSVSNLTCNRNALIFVQGNLVINPPIHSTDASNLSNINGCIFVVSGTVAINSGANVVGTFEYEKINAFIISDGVITINHQNQAIVDGVYINGGLISNGGSDSIDILRYLRLEERLIYPVLAIDLHPKYGILAEKFFGNSYVIQPTEVGLKPY